MTGVRRSSSIPRTDGFRPRGRGRRSSSQPTTTTSQRRPTAPCGSWWAASGCTVQRIAGSPSVVCSGSTPARRSCRFSPRGRYNQNMQLFQTPDHVVVFTEMVHEARIVPLDGRDQLPDGIRQWVGSSRGRWRPTRWCSRRPTSPTRRRASARSRASRSGRPGHNHTGGDDDAYDEPQRRPAGCEHDAPPARNRYRSGVASRPIDRPCRVPRHSGGADAQARCFRPISVAAGKFSGRRTTVSAGEPPCVAAA